MKLEDFNNEQYVAHYTSLDRLVSSILPSEKIRASSIDVLNDPYENTIDWIDDISYGEVTVDFKQYTNQIKANIQKHLKVFSTTSYNEEECKNSSDISNHIYCRPRMWAQYGDNHKGVCLIFEKNELHEQIDMHMCANRGRMINYDKVNYLSWMDKIDSGITLDYSEETYKECLKDPDILYSNLNANLIFESMFFRKHVDWSSENEFRWLLFSNSLKNLDILYGKSLKAIVLGCDVADRYSYCFTYDNDIEVHSLMFRDGKYQVDKRKQYGD
jgi:hypothetical protein